MIRGFYTSASGLVTQEKRLNAYANNIANASTPGYKKDNLVVGTFGEHLALRMNRYQRDDQQNALGQGVYMQTVDSKYTDYTQGGMDSTNRSLDFALQGDGFFVIDIVGEQFLTRNGQFALDDEGYLILPGYGRVQGEDGDIEVGTNRFDGGDIELETSRITVDRAGNIYSQPDDPEDAPVLIDRLLVVIPEDYATLEKTELGLYSVGEVYDLDWEDEIKAPIVMQGMLERSNVDMAEEMTRILSSQRGLQSASQLVRMYDEMSQKSNEQLGRVR